MRRSFHAAPIAIGTTSSLLPSVGIESTLAGCDRTLHSLARAAAVTTRSSAAGAGSLSSPADFAGTGAISHMDLAATLEDRERARATIDAAWKPASRDK